MKHRFQTRLLLAYLGLLILTLSATIIAVIRATDDNVRAIVAEELAVAERVLSDQLAENRRQLADRAVLLASDFAFKRAIATGESDTIISVLANHGERIAADMVLLLSRDGDVLISSHELGEDTLAREVTRLDGSPSESVVVSQGALYQLVTVPVLAPDFIARVGLGFEIDRDLLDRLKGTARADITLFFATPANHYRISTLADEFTAGNHVRSQVPAASTLAQLDQHNWLSKPITLFGDTADPIDGLVSLSLDAALGSYKPLRVQMVAVGALALAIAAVLAALLGRSITRPISALAKAATSISQGNYGVQLRLDDDSEFGILSTAFNQMQGAIALREEQIRHQASHDQLTGLLNRNQALATIESQLNTVDVKQFGLCLVELANLPALRDLYGNDCSDQLLNMAAHRIAASLTGDLVARFGDFQLLVFFPSPAADTLAQKAEALHALMAEPFAYQAISIRLDIGLGMVTAPDQGKNRDDLVRRLLMALAASRHTQNLFSRYQSGDDERHLRQIRTTHKLLQAIGGSDFRLFYQPKFDLHENRVSQVEALIRWIDPQMGFMAPDEFIPLAERSGNITLITRWVVAEGLKALADWRDRGIDLGMSLNLSAIDLLDGNFISWLLDAVAASGLNPQLVTLEVTESIVMTDLNTALAHLKQLRAVGLVLSMDDFGTGFSSLAQLRNLPVHEIKIDKSFVQTLVEDCDNQLIVGATISLAHQLGLKVVAEGVENLDSALLLRQLGCDLIQGYYLGKPMPSAEFERWLAAADHCPGLSPQGEETQRVG